MDLELISCFELSRITHSTLEDVSRVLMNCEIPNICELLLTLRASHFGVLWADSYVLTELLLSATFSRTKRALHFGGNVGFKRLLFCCCEATVTLL